MVIPDVLHDRLFLTDAGLETDMVFQRGIDLPHFSSITLLRTPEGRTALESYYRDFLSLARDMRTGFVLESATWRASRDWAGPLGLTPAELAVLNRAAIAMLLELKADHAAPETPILVSGCIGPRGDGYDPGKMMSADEAGAYHYEQVAVLADAGADAISAITMTNVPEATGVAMAARRCARPVVVSFTVETDGSLPTGESLGDAIVAVDHATAGYPAFFMINCAHPTHFAATLDPAAHWAGRIRGIRANASRLSHAELDCMTELDAGDPGELAAMYADLRGQLPQIAVLGGCCGTDVRHVAAIARACVDR